jgi:hypothetical protein
MDFNLWEIFEKQHKPLKGATNKSNVLYYCTFLEERCRQLEEDLKERNKVLNTLKDNLNGLDTRENG